MLWPNTRIPRADTTHTDDLVDCCIIEVDLESVDEADEGTRETNKVVLIEDTVVGQFTRQEVLRNTYSHARYKPTSTGVLIKDGTESTIGNLPYTYRTYDHQNKLERDKSGERIEERRSVPETPKRFIPTYDKFPTPASKNY
jgi:hypothetical protein